MKLGKLMIVIAALSFTNLPAAIISGYCFNDENGNGVKDEGELCSAEDVWAKIVNETVGDPGYGHVTVSKNLYSTDPSGGYYEFNTNNKTGKFRVFLDNNADNNDIVATPPANMYFTVDPLGDGSDTNLTNGETIYTISEGG